MLKMEELVDRTHNIEYAPTIDQSESLDESMADEFPGSDNSRDE